MQNKKIFFVIGMHRSGTSLVVNCLNRLGLRLSESLVPGANDNPNGFFEDAKLVELNTKLEKYFGREHSAVSSVLPLPDGWLNDPAVQLIGDEIRSYLSSIVHLSNQSLVLKDPRICRLLPLYRDILESLSIEVCCIFVHRAPLRVMQSKAGRDLLPNSVIELQWQSLNMEALTFIFDEALPVCFLSYENLVMNPKSELARVTAFLEKRAELTNLKQLPEITSKGLDRPLNTALEKYELSNFSQKLNVFLGTAGNSDKSNFNALLEMYESNRKTSLPLLESLEFCDNASREAIENSKTVTRLTASLKESNDRVFGAESKLKKLEKEYGDLVVIHDRVIFSRDKAEKDLKLVLSDYNELNNNVSDGGVLTSQVNGGPLNKRSMGYRFSENLHKIKAHYLMFGVRKTQFAVRRLLSIAKRIRQSINNKGIKQTCRSSARALVDLFHKKKNAFVAKKKIKNRRNSLRDLTSIVLDAGLGLSEYQTRIIVGMFVYEYYIEQAALDKTTSYRSAFKHFLEDGLSRGLSPSPLFNGDTYLELIGLTKPELKQSLFMHWLDYGVENRIVPTNLVDIDFFIQKYFIVLPAGQWGFEHFISTGVFNNISPNQYFEPDWYRLQHDMGGSDLPAFYHYLLIGYKLGWRPSPLFSSFSRKWCVKSKISPLEKVMTQTQFLTLRDRTMNSAVLTDLVKKANAIEPKIELPHPSLVQRLNVHPFSNPCFPANKSLRQNLNYSKYDNIVLIPHCRYGGSGLVAGELCHSLVRVFESEKTLLVRTDNDDFMRPDWFPDSIDIVNLLDFGSDLQDEYRKKLLLDVLIGLKPKRVFNVHSRLAWEVFEEFGDRLSRWMLLYGYTFCYDINILGAKVGYPVKYVPKSIEYMEKLYVDNSFVKLDMTDMHQWSTELSDKVEVLWTPYLELPSINANPKLKIPDSNRKNIFWAGRFDRQKRFDIVIKLAKANPQWDFWIWGAAMLGDDDVTQNLPNNIYLNGLFESYSEIPFKDCDVWLYTSQWDGVPTILIELGLREVSLVASRVWGTADLISEATAWPVDKVSSIDDYQVQLEQALANPGESKIKQEKMKALILKRHSREQYDKSIKASLELSEEVIND